MNNVLSFYFDGTIVQVLNVSTSRGSVIIREATTFLQTELDAYLSTCHEKKCVISYNPASFTQTIFTLPPSAGRHTDKLVGVELKRHHHNADSFVFFQHTIGEITSDAKPFNKIAAFSYDNALLDDIIFIFTRHNIVVSRVFASSNSIFKLVSAARVKKSTDTCMFIASLPGNKLCLLSENNQLAFVRTINSTEATLQQEDIHNITMTVGYCLQSLRLKPLHILIVNFPSPDLELSQMLEIPLENQFSLSIPGVNTDISSNYLAPLATALHFMERSKIGDLRPASYLAFLRDKKAYTHGTTLMILVAIFMAVLAFSEQLVISDVSTQIGLLRRTLFSSGDEIKNYRTFNAEIAKRKQAIELLNRHNTSLNLATVLSSLQIKRSSDYTIKDITVKKNDDFATVHITGFINGGNYSATQAVFEILVENISKTAGYTVSSSSVDVKLKNFTIDVRYDSNTKVVKK